MGTSAFLEDCEAAEENLDAHGLDRTIVPGWERRRMTDATLSLRQGIHSAGIGERAASIAQIDGLRGIAVLAVVLYHFAPAFAGGGFVGVDVFFVISGFLIGGILWREITTCGTINLGGFLLRRIRRLAPAYFTMAAISAAVAYVVLLPFEFREFGKSLIASVVYMSNIQLFREAGYFDIASEDKALLHTWSLSVEEQFYLALPILLLLLRRRRSLLVAVLTVIFTASLLACILVTPSLPTATFFLFPFRAWELILGVLLSIAWVERGLSGSYGAWVSWLGLGLLATAIAVTQPGDQFPGYMALLPTLGTALIIVNMHDRNTINTVLGSQPLVQVGLISYSLYLWHWPVLTFSSYYGDGHDGAAETGLWLAVAFCLATLSWRFVERPVREARALPSPRLVSAWALASATLVAAGVVAYFGNGLPGRFGPQTRMHIEASSDFIQDWRRCATAEAGPLVGIEVCRVGADKDPEFLVWGDSHVRAFKEGIDMAARENGSAGLLIWRAGCPPLSVVIKSESAATRSQDRECTLANEVILNALPQLRGIEKVLLVGRWTYYAEGAGVGDDAVNTIELKTSSARIGAAQKDIFFDAAMATVEEIRRHVPDVYVLQQVPEIPRYDSRDVARRLAHGHNADEERRRFVEPVRDVAARVASSEAPFLQLVSTRSITVIELRSRFCDQVLCSIVHDNRSYYFDNNHITNTAALAIRDIFGPFMRGDDRISRAMTAMHHDQ